jgi:hypothetical protein
MAVTAIGKEERKGEQGGLWRGGGLELTFVDCNNMSILRNAHITIQTFREERDNRLDQGNLSKWVSYCCSPRFPTNRIPELVSRLLYV